MELITTNNELKIIEQGVLADDAIFARFLYEADFKQGTYRVIALDFADFMNI